MLYVSTIALVIFPIRNNSTTNTWKLHKLIHLQHNMPRDLQSIINVVSPYISSQTQDNHGQQRQAQWESDGIQLSSRNERHTPCNWQSADCLPRLQRRQDQYIPAEHYQGRCRSARIAGLRYDFSRLCKAVEFLPSPMSRILYDDMKIHLVKVWKLFFIIFSFTHFVNIIYNTFKHSLVCGVKHILLT